MKIAVVHAYYSRAVPSGENVAVDRQRELLTQAGHEVVLVSAEIDAERHRRPSPDFAVRAALRVASGRGHSPLEEIRALKPDVVHVHNLFPLYARSWVRHWPGAMVATVHNFRPICPRGDLFRNGGICLECPQQGSAVPSLVHSCYHDSRAATLPIAIGTRFEKDAVLERADVVTALTPEMVATYAAAGVRTEHFREVPNFVDRPLRVGDGGGDWVVAGRATPEKGIVELIERWPRDVPLRVAGPMPEEVHARAPESVTFLGNIPSTTLREELGRARGLVFPSRCLEGLALVCLEALSVGTPIVAWDPCPAAAHVRSLGVGLVGSDDVVGTLRTAADLFPTLREHCRRTYERRFTPEAWTANMEQVYRAALEKSDARARA